MPFLLGIFTNKYVLIGIAVVGALIGVFEYGQSRGYQNGHDTGYAVAWNAQQQAINKLVDTQNALNEQQNKKISDLELSAQSAYADVQTAQQKAQQAGSDAVTAYRKAHPQEAKSCGWSPSTVQTINQILKANQ